MYKRQVVKALIALFGLIRRVWTPLKVGFPSCFAANGADTSDDDEDKWDCNTMFSSRSELNTIAAIENVRDKSTHRHVVQRVANWCRHSVTISNPENYWGLCTLSRPKNNSLFKSWCSTVHGSHIRRLVLFVPSAAFACSSLPPHSYDLSLIHI